MGSVENWHALNADRARRAAEELVWQNRAAHLREQGLLGPDAGPAEARAHDAELKRLERARRVAVAAAAQSQQLQQAAARKAASRAAPPEPKAMLLLGLWYMIPAAVAFAIACVAGSSGWIAGTGSVLAVTVGWSAVRVLVELART